MDKAVIESFDVLGIAYNQTVFLAILHHLIKQGAYLFLKSSGKNDCCCEVDYVFAAAIALPIPFPNRFLCVDGNIEPIQNIC